MMLLSGASNTHSVSVDVYIESMENQKKNKNSLPTFRRSRLLIKLRFVRSVGRSIFVCCKQNGEKKFKVHFHKVSLKSSNSKKNQIRGHRCNCDSWTMIKLNNFHIQKKHVKKKNKVIFFCNNEDRKPYNIGINLKFDTTNFFGITPLRFDIQN